MIGIFDSGVGGLSVLKAVRTLAPSADVVYFGDTKNAPYGQKSQAELSRLTSAAIRVLRERNVEHIISACNSVSASLVLSLFDALAFESRNLIEMVGPTALEFKESSERIALCATPATIESGVYQNAFAFFGKEVTYVPIPELAGAIEAGASDEVVEDIVRRACASLPDIDVLILACTHYPLVADVFKRVVGDAVRIYDPALGVARRAQALFGVHMEGTGTTQFLVSRDTEVFRRLAKRVCDEGTYTITVI